MKKLYEAVLRAMGNHVPDDYRFCSNCIAHLVKVELNNISFLTIKVIASGLVLVHYFI